MHDSPAGRHPEAPCFAHISIADAEVLRKFAQSFSNVVLTDVSGMQGHARGMCVRFSAVRVRAGAASGLVEGAQRLRGIRAGTILSLCANWKVDRVAAYSKLEAPSSRPA